MEDRSHKKHSLPYNNSKLDIKSKFILEEEGRLEGPLSQASMTSLNTKGGAWTNREELWTLEDKRMLFTTKSDQASKDWIEVLESILTDNIGNLCN
jgi:hypothetical protein